MLSATPVPPIAVERLLGGLAALGGIAWYLLLMRKVLAATALGPVCGHADLLGPHCPACYGALGMTAVGLVLLATSAARREVAPARSVAR